MNISLVLGSLARGGTERQVSLLANGLAARGHQVRIVLLQAPLAEDYPVADEVRVVALGLSSGLSLIRGWQALRREMVEADVVYSFLDIANALCALACVGLKTANRAQLVWGLRAANTAAGRLAKVAQKICRWQQAQVQLAVANASAVAAHYATQTIAITPTLVIANGVTPFPQRDAAVQQARWRQQHQIPKSAVVAVMLARVAPEKRQHLALRLLEQVPELVVVFVGHGMVDLGLRWQSDGVSLNLLNRCRFLPHCRDVDEVLLGADLLLSLSVAEGFPNTVLEAMSLGLPVIATAVGGVPEMVQNTGPIAGLIAADDLDACAAAIQQLQAAPGPARAQALQTQRLVQQGYSVTRMVASTERALLGLNRRI